ncbi:MAG: hypothetical protein QOE04_2500 [Mycobacterium sp.]|nr:hypothetical protein [Mycobacterium sp.]
MKVTVFGATGQLGRLVVFELLADGHDVNAYVRNLGKLQDVDPRLAVVTGELSDEFRKTVADAGGIAGIHDEPDRVGRAEFGQSRHRLVERLASPGHDRHSGAVGGEALGGGAAHAITSTLNAHGRAGQSQVHVSLRFPRRSA